MPRGRNVLKHTECLQFVVTTAQAKAIYAAAEQARKSVSAFVREVMDEHVSPDQPRAAKERVMRYVTESVEA
jgi:hypothetical protein